MPHIQNTFLINQPNLKQVGPKIVKVLAYNIIHLIQNLFIEEIVPKHSTQNSTKSDLAEKKSLPCTTLFGPNQGWGQIWDIVYKNNIIK